MSKAASVARRRRAARHSEVDSAGASLEVLQRKYAALDAKFREEVGQLDAALRPEALALERLPIRPRKADITVEQVVLAWTPWKVGAHGRPEPAYQA